MVKEGAAEREGRGETRRRSWKRHVRMELRKKGKERLNFYECFFLYFFYYVKSLD